MSYKLFSERDLDLAPILKWVGGKRQLMKEIIKYIPNDYNTYYEPFVGGGAVLFSLQPENAVINDINSELINVYKVIKNNLIELLEDLKKHKNNEKYFYKIRELDRSSEYNELSNVERASRIIFLNKTCYNGLYRVNSLGYFNAPFGKYKNPKIINEKRLFAIHDYFNNNNIKILNTNYYEALKDISKNDFVYFDPPYHPISESSSFTNYSKDGFDENDQIKLKKVCDELNSKGVKFLLSNSNSKLIKELYKDYKIEYVNAKRNINSKASKRGAIKEVLVRNYEWNQKW